MMKRLLLLVSILMLSLFGVLNAQTINPGYIDGHLYFKFNDDYDFRIKVNENTSIDFDQMPAEFTEMFERYGVTLITRPLYAFNDPKLERIIRLEFTDAQNIRLFIKELEMLEDVEYAEMVPYCTSKVTYNDPYYTSSTYQGVIPINYKWHLEMINAPQAWGIQQGSSSIKVAIVDNAVWGNHPDLQIATSNQCSVANGTAVPGNSAPPTSVSQSTQCSDLTGNNCPVYDWSHGTHCAGLVGAINNNGVGISSIGGGVTLIGVRAGNNDGEMYYNINGVAWAVNNGAKVVSMSYGSTQQSTSERTAYQSYYDNGVILVAAAGNEGDSDNSINYPAGYSTVISVASVNSDGKLSDFSQHGTGRADVAAPGGFQIYNYSGTDYDIVNILSTTYCKSQYLRLYGYENPVASGQYYDGMQGTSMATPIVAGLCGLMASAYPNITPAQAKQCLISTGTALASGSNTIDNNVYVNAYAAVQCAQSYSNSLVVTPTSLTLPSAGGSETVSVRAGTASSSWTASSNQSWLSISPATGSGSGATTNMTVTANSANETGSPRTATVTITHGSSTATVTVTQNDDSDLCITYNEDIMEDDSTGVNGIGSNLYYSDYFTKIAEKVNVTGNYTLDKIVFADMLNTATSGTIAIKVLSATSAGAPSTTELYSTNVNISTINNALTQGQLQSGRTCYYGEYQHSLNSPINVTGPFFICVDFTGVGAGTSSTMTNVVCISNSQNNGLANTAYIYSIYTGFTGWKLVSNFFGDVDNAKFAIQAHICPSSTPAPTLTVSPSSLSYAAAGGSKTVTVTSNTSWTATSSASWLTLSPASGSNNGTITAVAAANTSSSQRTATITVSANGVSSQTISVTQSGVSYNLTVNPSSLSYTAAGESKTVTVTSNTSWTATSSANWLTVSPASGSNNGTITAVAAANTSSSQRTATITVSGSGITRTISVTQAGVSYNLTVNPTSLSYTANGETKTVTVTSNTSWTATSSASWLTVSPASGSNNGTITAVAAANTSTQQRTATITVSGSGITRTINVTQAGAPTAIDEEVAEGISVYPNPTSGMFTVGLGSIEGKVTCQIVNVRGAVIETKDVNAADGSEVIFDTNVAAGVYFVRIISGDSVWTERVVIEK